MKRFIVVGKSEVILNLVANNVNLKAHFVVCRTNPVKIEFRAEALEKIAIEWLEENQISYGRNAGAIPLPKGTG
jgi:hypothetical protein